MLGGTLTDALTTPLWKWGDPALVEAAVSSPTTSPVQYVNVAQQAGLTAPNVWGGIDHKRSIIEAKGSGRGGIPSAPSALDVTRMFCPATVLAALNVATKGRFCRFVN